MGMLSASLLLAVAQASSLHPASTVALESFDRLMELSRNERTLYSGFKPPMPQRSYDEDYDVVASTRSLGCPMKWTTRGDFCYRHFSASTGGWTWDQARRECKSEAYSEGQMGADLPSRRMRRITILLKVSLALRMFGLELNFPSISYKRKPQQATLRPGRITMAGHLGEMTSLRLEASAVRDACS